MAHANGVIMPLSDQYKRLLRQKQYKPQIATFQVINVKQLWTITLIADILSYASARAKYELFSGQQGTSNSIGRGAWAALSSL